MAADAKVPSSSSFEIDGDERQFRSKLSSARVIDRARVSLTALALLAAVIVLGVSADTLHQYNSTHVSSDFLLPLWPSSFNTQPTVALVAGSTIVMISNIVSLVWSKVPTLRNQPTVHSSLTFIAPFVGLVGAIVGVAFYYAIAASTTEDTIISWSCRWQTLSMTRSPHFPTLCREGLAGVYLSVILIPLEILVLVAAAWQLKTESAAARQQSRVGAGRGKAASPSMS